MREIDSHWVIGDRDRFAIEFTPRRMDPAPFGDLALFVKGSRIGRSEDPVFIYSVLLDLEWVVDQAPTPTLTDRVFELSAPDAWALLQASGEAYRFAPNEMFDDYDIFVIRRRNQIRFLWRLMDAAANSPEGLQDSIVERSAVAQAVNDFRTLYDELRGAAPGHQS